VGDWQNKLAPILEEEDQRPEFDIHRYSDHVVQLLKSQVAGKGKGSNSNKSLDFQSVTRKSEQYEVCRLFLASLSLSNSGNVAFSAEEGCVATPDSLRLELLDEDIDRPMEKYLAPSAHALVQ
jgi:condensin-2 complex subunit H2